MKTINAIVKVLTALATVAGAVYIIATYGDKIVAWAKSIWEKFPEVTAEVTVTADEKEEPCTTEEETAEPAPTEEAPAEEPAEAEEAAPAVEENVPVADEADFEG